MEFAILVFFAFGGLVLAASILMLVTRRDLGRLRREVERLNFRLAKLESEGDTAAPAGEQGRQASPIQDMDFAPAPSSPAPPSPVSPQAPGPRRARAPWPRNPDLEKLIGGQWLTWLGIIAIFLGTAFFLAFDLGPSPLSGLPQVLIAVAVAAVFLAVGRRLTGGVHNFLGLGLQGGGIALLYLAAYGLFGFHHLVGVEIVFPALLVVAVVGALAALWEDSLTIAGLTLVGALATPLVLVGENGWGVVLLPYLIAVGLGAVLVGRRRGWAGLPLGAFAGTFALVSSWWEHGFSPDQRGVVLAALTLMWVLFGLVPWLGRVRPGFWGLARTVMVAANGACYSAAVYAALGRDLQAVRGTALFAVAVLYIVASILGGRTRRGDPALVANFYTGAALLILAVPVQFDDFTVSLAWALVGTLLLVMGWRLRDPHHRFAALLGLGIAAARIVLTGTSGLGNAEPGLPLFLNLGFLADAAVVVMLLVADWIYRALDDDITLWEKPWSALIQPVAALLGWWILTTEIAHWSLSGEFSSPPLLSVPLVWAVYGIAMHRVGVWKSRRWLRGVALASLGLATVGSVAMHAGLALTQVHGWRTVLNSGFIAGAVTAAGLVATSRRSTVGSPGLHAGECRLAVPLLLAAHGLILAMGSLEIAAWFRLQAEGVGLRAGWGALVSISIFWTLYGGGLIWGGFLAQMRSVRLAGMSLLTLVILKVFLVDIRALSAGYRIVSFVVVGLLLLVISLLYQRERRTGSGAAGEIGKD